MIKHNYSTRFQDSGTRIGRGVFSKTAGTVLGGFGMMGQVASTVINSATDLSFGFIKIAGASKDFKQKMIQKIKDQAQNLPSSKSMMQSYLEINSNNAQAIMEELNKAGFIISNEDIDYKNCPKIITLNLNEFNATKDTILTNCNRIAQYMGATDNHQTQRTALQKNLAQTFITQLQGTFSTEIVQPVMNIPAGYAAGYVSEKFAESLAKLAKSGKQEPTEDADPVKIKNKKKNKFTPTKRGDSSNQDEAGETNDENSPRKPFRKFTKVNENRDIDNLKDKIIKLVDENKKLTPEQKAQFKNDIRKLTSSDKTIREVIFTKYQHNMQNIDQKGEGTVSDKIWKEIKKLNPIWSDTANAFDDTMVEIAALSGLVLLLGSTINKDQKSISEVSAGIESLAKKLSPQKESRIKDIIFEKKSKGSNVKDIPKAKYKDQSGATPPAPGFDPDDDPEKEEWTKNPTKSESKIWKKFKSYRGKIRTNDLKGKKQQFYEWDHTHNDIEVYDHNGNHLGSINPRTGKIYKPAEFGRTIRHKLR